MRVNYVAQCPKSRESLVPGSYQYGEHQTGQINSSNRSRYLLWSWEFSHNMISSPQFCEAALSSECLQRIILGLRGREKVIWSKLFFREIPPGSCGTDEKREREQVRRPQSRGPGTGPGHAGVTRQGHTSLIACLLNEWATEWCLRETLCI